MATEQTLTWTTYAASRYGRFVRNGIACVISMERAHFHRASGVKGYRWDWRITSRDESNNIIEHATGTAWGKPATHGKAAVADFLAA